MRDVLTEVPETRVCVKGCRGETPQPIDNFYKGGMGAAGVQLYQHACKKCVSNRENARYHAKTPEARKRAREPRDPGAERGEFLTSADLTPCVACGLRGHYAGDAERCPLSQPRSTGLGARGADWGLT